MSHRQKRVYVEAKQWWPPGAAGHDPSMLTTTAQIKAREKPVRVVGDLYQVSATPGYGDDLFMMRTSAGDCRVYPGDWIVTDPEGFKYPCTPHVFQQRYEPVPEHL